MHTGLSPTSNNEEPLLRVHHAPWTIGIFVRPFRCVLANSFLLLVGASPPRIENRLKFTKLELAHSMAFDNIYVFSRRRQRAPQGVRRFNCWIVRQVLYKSLCSLLEYEDDDIEDVFEQSFEVSFTDCFGASHSALLLPQGDKIRVNHANKHVSSLLSWWVMNILSKVFLLDCKLLYLFLLGFR